MQSQQTSETAQKRSRLPVATGSAELYSIPHIISHSFYGPCHHASRSINALSPTVCLFTPNSHPSNKFHPSPLRSPPFTRGPNSCSPNITCPLWGRRRGEKEGTKGRGKVIQTEKRTSLPSFSPLPLLSLLPPDCLGCVCYTAAGFSRGIGGRFNRIAWFRDSLNLCPFLHTCSAFSPLSLFRLPSILGWSGKRRRSGVKLVALPGWRWRGERSGEEQLIAVVVCDAPGVSGSVGAWHEGEEDTAGQHGVVGRTHS